MTFDSDIRHWPTVAAFVAYLQTIARPAWCVGITNHNTYIPNETQWRGAASMRTMQAAYVGKGWTSGPNLYLAAEAPSAADIGIWQMTPITHQGTHAGECNRDHLGVENVGDFDARPPSAAQLDLLYAVNEAIIRHWGLQIARINVHNECMPGRTCPGRYLTGTEIRAELTKRLAPTPRGYRVAGLPVYQRSDRTGPLWGILPTNEQVVIDDPTNGHLQDGRGFVDMQGLV